MKNNKIIFWVLGIIVLVIAGYAIFTDTEVGTEEVKGPRKGLRAEGKIVTTTVLENEIFANGSLMSNEEVEIRSEINGKIVQILFEEGKRVKKNDLLLKINDAELQATLKKNKSKEVLARDKENRYRQLLEKSLTSQQEYDVVMSELNSVQADVEFTQAQISKTEIRAPFDGVIGLRAVSTGSYISPQSKIATLQSINPIKVDFSIPQKYFGKVSVGQKVTVQISSGDKKYEGRIYAIEPKIDQTTRTVQVRAIIPNESGTLYPGAYVEIYLLIERISDAIMVPTELLIPDIEGEKIYISKNGRAFPQKVNTGVRTEQNIQITEGLKPGDTLITSGIIQIRPNMPVKLKVTK